MARSRALTELCREQWLRFKVYTVAHEQAGAAQPRNQARADVAALYPERYRALYAAAKDVLTC